MGDNLVCLRCRSILKCAEDPARTEKCKKLADYLKVQGPYGA